MYSYGHLHKWLVGFYCKTTQNMQQLFKNSSIFSHFGKQKKKILVEQIIVDKNIVFFLILL